MIAAAKQPESAGENSYTISYREGDKVSRPGQPGYAIAYGMDVVLQSASGSQQRFPTVAILSVWWRKGAPPEQSILFTRLMPVELAESILRFAPGIIAYEAEKHADA